MPNNIADTKPNKMPPQLLEKRVIDLSRYFFGRKDINSSTELNRYFNKDKSIKKFTALLYNDLGAEIKINSRQNFKIDNIIFQIQEKLLTERNSKEKRLIIKPTPKKKYYPLSHAQKRLFVLYKLEPKSPFYNTSFVQEIRGNFNISLFKKALRVIINRHESLRTYFGEREGIPVQIILPRHNPVFDIIIITKIRNFTEKKIKIDHIIRKNTGRPFNLESDPPIRTTLLKYEKDKYILAITMHHIITDGWSMNIFYRELSLAYKALINKEKFNLPKLPIQYKDHVVWEQSKENEKRLIIQEKYWLKQLLIGSKARNITALNLPTDKFRPLMQTYNGAIECITFDINTTKKIKKLCREYDVTLFMFLFSVFSIILHKLSNQDDIIIGTLRANRNYAELENMIGLLHNNLPIRIKFLKNGNYISFLRSIKKKIIEALDNSEYSFDQLIEKLNPQKDISRSPIFNCIFQIFEKDTGQPIFKFDDLEIKHKRPYITTAQFDLRCAAVIRALTINISFNYNTDLFYPASIKRWLSNFSVLVENIIKDPGKKIKDIKWLSVSEEKTLINKFNNTKTPYPKQKTIHQLFEEQAKKTPENMAIKHKNKELIYDKLNQKANQLAHYLRDDYKIKPDQVIAIMLYRSPEMIISILSVLKAGAAYLPISPEYPEERIKYLIRDSGAIAVISTHMIVQKLKYKALNSTKIIDINNNCNLLNNYSTANLACINKPTDLACIIYTSGSTGYPKGVMLTHQGIINHAITKAKLVKITKTSVIAQNLSAGFVASIWQFTAPLIVGARLIIYSRDVAVDIHKLFGAVAKDHVTLLEILPRLLEIYLHTANKKKDYLLQNIKLKYIILTGEKVSADLVNKYYRKHKITLINAYGQTECSDDTLHYKLFKKINYIYIPAGTPSANTQVYILDQQKNLVPFGVPGELYISGDGLARGYLNDPERTRQVFLPYPFRKTGSSVYNQRRKALLYKTGDRAKMHPDGNIEILGRIDRQINIGGQRVELGEIELTIKKIDSIKECIVIKAPKNELVAYYTTKHNRSINSINIKAKLKTILPEFMMPKYFVKLKDFPINISGKIDQKQLPLHTEKNLIKNKYEAPKTVIEKTLAEIWQEILEIKKISLYDDFFNLGGNSLYAIQLLSRINYNWNIKIELADIFLHSSLFELSQEIKQLRLKNLAADLNNHK